MTATLARNRIAVIGTGVAVAVPGPDIKVSRDHSLDGAHEDLYVAIRDAFRAARRQLADLARRQRADIQ